MTIDEPLEVLLEQYEEVTRRPSLEQTLGAVGLSVLGPLGELIRQLKTSFLGDAFQHRVHKLFEAIVDRLQEHDRDIEALQTALNSQGFCNTAMPALEKTLFTTDIKKIERFGMVLGQAIIEDRPEVWDESAGFMRDLHELSKEEIQTLDVLNEVLGDLYSSDRTHYNPNSFTERHAQLHEVLHTREIPFEDFYARCLRLSGFGLTIEVERNRSRVPQGQYCFRLTNRGKRLISMLKGSSF